MDDEITLTENRKKVIDYILQYPQTLLQRAMLQDLFTIVDKPIVDINDPQLEHDVHVFTNRFVSDGTSLYGIQSFTKSDNATKLTLIKTDIEDIDDRLVAPRTRFKLNPGDIPNYPDDGKNIPITTSIGKFIANYVLLVNCFNDVIPYINHEMEISKLNQIVSDVLLDDKVTPQQCQQFLINITYLEIPEYIAPNLTTNALIVPDNIKKEKDRLLNKYKDRLKNGDPVAMVDIEQPLIAMDKANMKNDYSSRYLIKKKQYNIIRKKMICTVGMSEKFGDPGKFAFVDNSLSEGWTQQMFPQIANDIRMGSHSRALETAKGGEESKYILRVLQNVKIDTHDCGSTKGEKVVLSSDNAHLFTDRHIITPKGLVLLTKENISTYFNKSVTIRSPNFCIAENGFCYTCVSSIFEQVGQKYIATSVQNFSSMFLTLSLKAFHGKSVETVQVTKLNKFLI